MEILIGCAGLIALAAVLTILAAYYDDGFALRVAAILLARASARDAYRAQYGATLRDREREFGIEKRQTEQAQ